MTEFARNSCDISLSTVLPVKSYIFLNIYKSLIHTHLHGVTLHIKNRNNKNHIKNIKSTKKVVLPQSYIKALPSTQL